MARLTDEERERILAMLQVSISSRVILQRFGCDHSTITRLRGRYQQTGTTMDHPRPGTMSERSNHGATSRSVITMAALSRRTVGLEGASWGGAGSVIFSEHHSMFAVAELMSSTTGITSCEMTSFPSGQVRSGQVRVFNVHIQSKLL